MTTLTLYTFPRDYQKLMFPLYCRLWRHPNATLWRHQSRIYHFWKIQRGSSQKSTTTIYTPQLGACKCQYPAMASTDIVSESWQYPLSSAMCQCVPWLYTISPSDICCVDRNILKKFTNSWHVPTCNFQLTSVILHYATVLLQLPTGNGQLLTIIYQLATVICQWSSGNRQLTNSNCQFPTASRQLPTGNKQLTTGNGQLSICTRQQSNFNL